MKSVILNCKNCGYKLEVNICSEDEIYECVNCNYKFRLNLKSGTLILFVFPTIVMILVYFLFGNMIDQLATIQLEVIYFIIFSIFILYFIYRPYSMKIINKSLKGSVPFKESDKKTKNNKKEKW